MSNQGIKRYRNWTFEQVVATGKISAEDLQKAIDTKQVHLVTGHPSGEERLLGVELHRRLGLDIEP